MCMTGGLTSHLWHNVCTTQRPDGCHVLEVLVLQGFIKGMLGCVPSFLDYEDGQILLPLLVLPVAFAVAFGAVKLPWKNCRCGKSRSAGERGVGR